MKCKKQSFSRSWFLLKHGPNCDPLVRRAFRYMLVAWTFSSCRHGCCDTGCAGNMDVITWRHTTLRKGHRPGAQNTGGPIDFVLCKRKTSKNPKRAPPAGVRQDAGSEGKNCTAGAGWPSKGPSISSDCWLISHVFVSGPFAGSLRCRACNSYP